MTAEPPEHRACRTNTNPERRGVEAALDQWRLGDSNWRNVYIGTRHVGVLWEPGLPEYVVATMNAANRAFQKAAETPVDAFPGPSDAGPP